MSTKPETLIYPETGSPQESNIQIPPTLLPDNATSRNPLKDSAWIFGAVLLIISTIVLNIESQRSIGDSVMGIFPINFMIAIVYGLYLIASDRMGWWVFQQKSVQYDTFFVYLSIWLVSCFALNREMQIFYESTDWLTAHLAISCITCILYPWRNHFTPVYQKIWFGAMAWSFVLMFYFTMHLWWAMGIGVVTFWFFGISLHAYVPLLFSLHIGYILYSEFENNKKAILIGAAIPMAIAAVFTLVWNIQSKQLHDIFNDKIGDNDLPHWINASQRMPNNVFSDLILEGDLYYQVPEFNQKTSFFGGLNRDKRVHNPLIYIATLFSPLPKITEDEQVKILKNQFDSRHDMHDRLWTGKDLRISSITTKASINSSVRTAYTEKILTIENSGRDGTWRPNLQEAFFTLYMPDGAVVSSLSLWVNGKEEKSRLSSKSKADSAYTTIVGRERRDPALVHWQEGNTVTLRVFPCTPQEARKVKIGYTAPLREEDGNLIYDNMTLQGPPATGSIEDLNIKIESNNTKDILEMPGFFNKNNDGILTAKTKYTPDWQIKLRGVNFEPQSFTFNNKTYRAEPIVLEKENFIPEAIYLDLNNAWSANEVYHILKNTPNIPIRVWLDSEFKTLQLSDYQSFIKNKLSFSYSLFPFHKLPMPEKSLVISKSSGISPLLVELKDTKFGEEMKARLNNSLTRLFHIGSDCSPYIDALRQMRLVQLHTGNLAQLIELLNKNEFYKNPEDENSVVIANSGLRITREAAAIPAISSRNDHLMRLFAYHNILKEIGSKNLTDNYEPAALVREAEEAFVVTPVSSMVVLETKADYERMGIDKNTSTLGNASFKNNGAVPEPHEWALIGLLIIALLWVWKRNWI